MYKPPKAAQINKAGSAALRNLFRSGKRNAADEVFAAESTVFPGPVIGYIILMGIYPILVRIIVVVNLCRTINHHGLFHSYTFESVADPRRDLQQQRLTVSKKEFIHFTKCPGPFTLVIQDDLHHAADNDKIIHLFFGKPIV